MHILVLCQIFNKDAYEVSNFFFSKAPFKLNLLVHVCHEVVAEWFIIFIYELFKMSETFL